jgi:cold shock CspA family protein
VNQSTDYDDGLKGFADLREGQKVEVDFEYRDGKHFATEIELED